jgi:hypothetical protein
MCIVPIVCPNSFYCKSYFMRFLVPFFLKVLVDAVVAAVAVAIAGTMTILDHISEMEIVTGNFFVPTYFLL